MKPEWLTLFGLAVTIGTFIWHAAQMAERQNSLRREFEKFERDVKAELEKMNDRLANGVGGRRRYQSASSANDRAPPDA